MAPTSASPALGACPQRQGPQQESSDKFPTSAPYAQLDFSPTRCLFCQAEACDTDTNLGHMRKAHGLLIPATDRLIVDVGTLLGYLHVVIFDLKECILCHTARRTASAVQQHMTGKGHCRIDLESENAEMLEFYEADNELARSRQCIAETHESPEISRMTLGLGKVALPKTAHASKSLRQTQTLLTTQPDGKHEPPMMSKDEKNKSIQTRQSRLHDAFETRLANLRSHDRASIMHLPRAQQLSTLAAAQKQREQAQKIDRRARGRLEGKNNSTMMKHFVSDVPGPKLG